MRGVHRQPVTTFLSSFDADRIPRINRDRQLLHLRRMLLKPASEPRSTHDAVCVGSTVDRACDWLAGQTAVNLDFLTVVTE
jgi:hypothetical protein